MNNNKLEEVNAQLLADVTGGVGLTSTIAKRLGQIWSHAGAVKLEGKPSFHGLNGSVLGNGKFTVNELSGGEQERSWTAKFVNGAVQKVRTKLIGWTN